MKKLLISLAVLAIPTVAFAQGIDLSWNDCVGSATATQNKNFVCTGTVNQTYKLVHCFKSPVSLGAFVAFDAFLDLQVSTAGPLAPFYHYETGGCQGGTVKGVAIFDNISVFGNCVANGFSDPWAGDGSGGLEAIAAYLPDNPVPGRGHFVYGDASTGAPQAIPAGVNYYAVDLDFNNKNKNVCTGCATSGATVWNTAFLESNDGTPVVVLSSPDKGSNCATFNNGPAAICAATPVHNRTWGSIKSLYR